MTWHRLNIMRVVSDRKGYFVDRLTTLKESIKDFVTEREWTPFHTPKNLAICLSVEASELLELYQWQIASDAHTKADGGGPPPQNRVEEEVGDIMISLLNFCQVTGIDPVEAGLNKLEQVKKKYPVEHVKGSAAKPTTTCQTEDT